VAIVGGLRVVIRTVRDPSIRTRRGGRRALVVGAGDAGDSLIREIGRDRHGRYRIVGLVDDDPGKQGMRLHGIPVFGTPEDLPGLARQYKVQEILIAMPSATREQWLRVMRYCRACALPFKSVPPLRDLLAGKAGIGQLQEVRPEDVLGRERVHLDDAQLRQNLCGKRVVVTGAAGSIGSELCRQLAALSPEELVLIDRAENNLYFVHLELVRTFPQLTIVPVVGDISDGCKIEEVIRHHRPHALYHAAAYKHVPLMEADPLEAVKNNVFGTDVVAAAALAGGVEKFVLISTDKAVRPVGVMGMTKRLAEGLVRYYGDGDRDFVAVRFGNVLGSDGSVLPLFRWQIASGGPVTITEPEASRYFMLISEAAQLVLQAGALGRGGEVFFLDMGEPVRILDLAETVIRQSGLEPHQDIAVEFVGLRPGERLREELVLDDETLSPTAHARVLRVRGQPFDREAFRDELEMLRKLVEIRDRDGVRHALKDMSERY
jgi:FlaA1/EpsC-like NDP-sugar epimerase